MHYPSPSSTPPDKGDILIDNTFYTIRRNEEWQTLVSTFIGTGVSGGEGALEDPFPMPGRQKEPTNWLLCVLEEISAKESARRVALEAMSQLTCHRSEAGHYVKMVHNVCTVTYE